MTFGLDSKTKAQEASEHQTSPAPDFPPTYSSSSASPPTYDSIRLALNSLSHGPLDETVSVPMVHRKDPTSLHRLNPFSRKGYEKVESYITARRMKREQYLKHYAKDAEGNYVGTAPPAPDAGLVFVLGRSTPEALLKQVEETAFAMQERRGDGIGKFGKPLH